MMFPLAIISNTVIQPKPFMKNTDVIYRNDHTLNDWRTAREGIEYIYNDGLKTELGLFAIPKYFTIRVPSILGKRLFLRYKFNGSFTSCILNPWGSAELFKMTVTPNTWHTLEVQFGATASSQHTWIVDSVQRYKGTIISPVYFTFSSASSIRNVIEFDVGTKGGILPSGCQWWYTV